MLNGNSPTALKFGKPVTAQSGIADYSEELLKGINDLRERNGLPQLQINEKAQRIVYDYTLWQSEEGKFEAVPLKKQLKKAIGVRSVLACLRQSVSILPRNEKLYEDLANAFLKDEQSKGLLLSPKVKACGAAAIRDASGFYHMNLALLLEPERLNI